MFRTTRKYRPAAVATGPILILTMMLSGCTDDSRVTQVAREAADRQAEQNRQIAHQNQEIAETTKRLVEADATARKEIIASQHDLQGQQADVGRQRDALETERKEIAQERRWDSVLGPAFETIAVLLVCALALGLCGYLIYGLRHDGGCEAESEILVRDLTSDRPVLLPHGALIERAPRRTPLPALPPDRLQLPDRDP